MSRSPVWVSAPVSAIFISYFFRHCGFFSKYFVDQGMAVTALDYSWAALDITKHMTQRRVRAVQGDLLVEPLPPLLNDKFDVIFSDGLLEHFSKPDQDKIVQNLISVLNEKGFLITVVPNRWSPWEIIRPIFMPGIDEKPFVLGQLQDLNTRNGLKIVQQGGLNTLPFAFSPEGMAAKYFGMLLYTVAQQK